VPSGFFTSQKSRATGRSDGRQATSWKVAGSGKATMSDSWILVKPVMDEPSKPMPSSKAFSSSRGVIWKLLSTPSTSMNQNWMKETL